MIKRITTTILVLALILDMFIGNILRAPIYWFTGWDWSKPSARQTISAVTGHLAAKGYTVGIILETIIDEIFGKGHCALSARLDTLIREDEESL